MNEDKLPLPLAGEGWGEGSSSSGSAGFPSPNPLPGGERAIAARVEAIAAMIEAEARAEYPEFVVTREGATVTIAGRGLARLRLDDPLLANPALLAAGAS